MAKAPTSRRSPLEESPLANMVEISESTEEAEEFTRSIEAIMKEREVPRPIAEIMAKTGYSKGTAYRIFNDGLKRAIAAKEKAAGIQA